MTIVNNSADIRPLSDSETAEVSGGFIGLAFIAIAQGIAAGIGYCIGDGTLKIPDGGSAPGDYPTGPKNTG